LIDSVLTIFYAVIILHFNITMVNKIKIYRLALNKKDDAFPYIIDIQISR
jgi:hypothetical protein